MEKELTMPKLRPEMEKGVLCAWLKEEGDTVTAGEPLYEIETDKVVNQIEATESGVLKKQLCEEGDTVEIFGDQLPVTVLSDQLQTIPYEVLTSVSNRVKRVYFQ